MLRLGACELLTQATVVGATAGLVLSFQLIVGSAVVVGTPASIVATQPC